MKRWSQRKPFRRAKRQRTSSGRSRWMAPAPGKMSGLSDLQYFDVTVGPSNAGNTVQTTSLFQPTVGTGSTNRYGDRTIMKGIQYNLAFKPGSAQNTTDQWVRILILYDRQPNGAGPASPLPLTSASPYAFKDADYRYRFQILRDFLVPVVGIGAPVSGFVNNPKSDYVQRGYIKTNLVSQFSASAGSIADVVSGSLLLMFVGDTAVTTNNVPVITGQIRCIFKS